MSHTIDLGAYARRIGFEGSFRPDFETLNQIVSHHAASIPFENLDVLLGRTILLATEAIEQKLVGDRRGGYCFEQNGLLLTVLQQIGFEAYPLAARVRVGLTRDTLPPRTHLFVKVILDGEAWMADVGVGGLSLTCPIQLDSEEVQTTPHESRRILREGGKSFHQALLGSEWTDVHEFTGEEMPLVDRQLANWWTSTNPTSKFHLNLMVGRSGGPGIRYGILNDRFTKRINGTVAEETLLTSASHLLDVLGENFGLEFPSGARFGKPGAAWPAE